MNKAWRYKLILKDMRGSGASTALPALCATRKWDTLQYLSFCFSPLSLLPSLRLVSKFCDFFKTLFHLFCLCWFFWLSINMQCEHWRPARCHKCYWLAYYTEKRAAVIKCHWPQKMYHPPFSLLPPLSFPIPIYLFIYLLYLIFDFNFIVIFYLITSRLGESQARSAAMWQPDMTGRDMTWRGSRLSKVNDRT